MQKLIDRKKLTRDYESSEANEQNKQNQLEIKWFDLFFVSANGLISVKADEEGGGGSDIGRFLGGLTGAFIKGVAQPPGPVSINTR